MVERLHISHSRAVRGAILAGTHSWGGTAFERAAPRPLLPIAQAPLISYAARWLRDEGVAAATVCANSSSRAVRAVLGDGSALGLRLDYYEDWVPRGAAGSARDACLGHDVDT